ncbi:MAG: YihY/virulence factor BrkB family protein [Sphingomonas bacterium]|nr:YihY/virulence factor BrkB family protein [Sphingomonas bacterium]
MMRRSVPTFLAEGPWRLTGRDWLANAVRTLRGARKDDYGTAASAIAFASFLALLPLLGAVALTYGMVTPSDRVVADIRALLFILPGEARGFMGDWLVRSITRSEGREAGLLISIAIALFSALRAGRTIIGALNTASGVETRRGFVRRRIIALLIVFGGAMLILGALFAIASLAWIERALPPGLTAILATLRAIFWTSATGGAVAALALIYRYAPNRSPPTWRWIFPGALVATLAWLLATLAFGWYLGSFGRTKGTYGAVGAIVALQLWLYLSGYIMLLGAKLNAELIRSAGMETGGST